ncbi:MAG TPA: alpha-glucan family phosphorylase [Solirubrobacteraceae bacterium]|jgi:starch phosphorylase|nr:alpha-glucan family phosphorylase [Solirubrobacteraceae bacterium]
MFNGQRDVEAAAANLATRVPEVLAPLARLAYNCHWSWQAGGESLFGDLDGPCWQRVGRNPVALLRDAPASSLERAAADDSYVGRLASAVDRLDGDLARPAAGGASRAFFCAEYAIHASLPIYSGGLGALAGDFLKQASDDALPYVAIGLLYRQGYFRQRIDASGLQHEYWVDADLDRLPAALVTGSDGEPLLVSLPIGEETVSAAIWRVDVGRVPLYLLDTQRPENSRLARWVASRLYVSAPELRIAQYVLLGAGGVRALAAMGVDAQALHLNEGHAAFAALELVRGAIEGGADGEQALAEARRAITFTTHTPVPAGNDTYPIEQLAAVAGDLIEQCGLELEAVAKLGRSVPDAAAEPFGMTQFALRTSARANGVSRRHGEVAREMWRGLWPDAAVDDVPIGYVTNGVHVPTWLGGPMRALLERHLGGGWLGQAADGAAWEAIDAIPDEELWSARGAQRAALVEAVRDRSVAERLGRGDARDYAQAAASGFEPETLTIGFARRLATYKRLALLVSDRDAAVELLRGERPIQIVLAGKAHPRDDDAKRMLQDVFALKSAPEVAGRVVFLDDYDLASAALMVQGCDLWVNVPRPPLEASGTSGMKSAMNGGLQLSVADGWWAEAFQPGAGWALSGEVESDTAAQDTRDGAELRRVLAEEIVPLFYERDGDGLPRGWLASVRSSLRLLGPGFNAQRMLRDYAQRIYER